MPVPTSFKLKHFTQITASEVNWMASVQGKITDFNIGSVGRTLLEAFAMEVEEFYYRMVDALEAEIPNSAYEAFGFSLQSATKASGTVTFGRSTPAAQDYVIPAGTIVSTTDLVTFQTIASVTLSTGLTTAQTGVVAVTAGLSGNVSAGAIGVLNGALLGIETVTNPLALTGGTDQESEESRANRFRIFIESLPRTTIGGLVGGAMTASLSDGGGNLLERVREAKTVEPYLTGAGPRSVVDLYIDNGSGTASANLIAATQDMIDGSAIGVTPAVTGYRSAGITVNVKAVSAMPINVTTTITIVAGETAASVQEAVKASIGQYINGLHIHDPLDWERLLTVIITTPGVQTAVVSLPTVDQVPGTGQRITAGAVTVNVS